MAFGIGTNTQKTNAGKLKGIQMSIACECWFTSKGESKPLMIKFEDEEGVIQTVREIQVHYVEEKNYSGIGSREYDCTMVWKEQAILVKLIYFKEECRWVMNFLQ